MQAYTLNPLHSCYEMMECDTFKQLRVRSKMKDLHVCSPVSFIIKPINDAGCSPHTNNFSVTKCNHNVVECLLLCFTLKLCVLSGGAGVCPAERPSIQQGQPHLPSLEDQRQEVRTDFPEPC